ncbi:competence protein ComX [Lysinibacillus contaminans]|uniref:ComX pheromone n=1 Tax=Lysinibacillus contaminans TaxID=1293441 RepID=A0ABR5JY07_9BACI|nr:competence pheromone ComX [Lysinibacillus contaminans]KOS66974.1 competence protein ComX [Lysinibacillus contaminans]
MIKAIQYLEQNPMLVELLREKKVSLIGVNDLEVQAIVEAFDDELRLENPLWN